MRSFFLVLLSFFWIYGCGDQKTKVTKGLKSSVIYGENDIKEYMQSSSIIININLNLGSAFFSVYTCDLTHDYIDINADYRN